MLQQTQVARVEPAYRAFLRRFPTLRSLADADEQDVLAAWSGLGYYRRARLLHRAARAIVNEHAGRTPSDPDRLADLPGVGRYTAGAIASIVFNRPAPIVDANVARVLMRLHAREGPAGDRDTQRWAWERAGQLAARAGERVGAFNEALMELGATVCAPQAPKCLMCPLTSECSARQRGVQEAIPGVSKPPRRKDLHLACALLRDEQGLLLVERRPDEGLWGGMWQPPTLESDTKPSPGDLSRALELDTSLTLSDAFTHLTTHRTVHFSVHTPSEPVPTPRLNASTAPERRWLPPEKVAGLALSNPHRRILLGGNAVAVVRSV
jgi:A/G-specific adenine glycosylase